MRRPLLAATVPLLLLTACSAGETPPQPSPTPTLSQQEIWNADFVAHLMGNAALQPDRSLELGQELCKQLRLGNVGESNAMTWMLDRYASDPGAAVVAVAAPQYLCPDWRQS